MAPLRLERLAVTVLGVYLVGVALHALATGRVLYANYLHLPAAAPLTLIVVIALLAIAIRWRHLF